MEFLIGWIIFTGVQLAATMSPGPAFAVLMRNIVKYGRKGGLFTALGLGAGVGLHAALALCGMAIILAQVSWMFELVKYIGAAYLVYIGVKGLKAKPEGTPKLDVDMAKGVEHEPISAFRALQIGFWTNALNPKAVIFFTAIFTQFIEPDAALSVLVLYGFTSVIVEILWFSLLALILTIPSVGRSFKALQHGVERVCGGLLVALGIKLALSKI